MDKQRTRYINSRRGHLASPPGETPASLPPRAAVGHEGHPNGHQALDVGAAEGGAEAPADELWLSGFQPREKVEHLRNCATLPRDFIDQVVLQVAHLLLDREEQISIGDASSSSSKAWNRGGRPPTPAAAACMPAGFQAVARCSLRTDLKLCGGSNYVYFKATSVMNKPLIC